MLDQSMLQSIIKSIVEHQVQIIGPLAIEQANKVSEIKVSDGKEISIEIKNGNPDKILTSLARNYEELFGRASLEVCKDAIKEIKPQVPTDQLPDIFKS